MPHNMAPLNTQCYLMDPGLELKKWINKNADKIKKMKFQKPNFVPESEKIARSKSWCIQ